MTTITETQFQTTLIEAIRTLGGMVYHTYDSRRSEPGYPDLTIVTPDRRVIFAELKNATGRPTVYQWTWLGNLPDHQAFLWRPDDFDDAIRICQYGHYPPNSVVSRDGYEPTCIACQRRMT